MIRLLALEAIADMAEEVCANLFWSSNTAKHLQWDILAADTRKVILSCYGFIE